MPSPSKAMRRMMTRGAALADIDASQGSESDESYYGIDPDKPWPPLIKAAKDAKHLIALVNRAADRLKLNHRQQNALRLASGQAGATERLLASSALVRLKLIGLLIKHWAERWVQHSSEPHRRYWWLTIAIDKGNTLARKPIVNLEGLRRSADKLLREFGLGGVFLIEVQVLTNFPRYGHGASHQWHVHVIVTTNGPDFDELATEAAMQALSRLSNVFGKPTVTIKPIPSLADLKRCCAYLLKLPVIGKFIAPDPKIPDEWTFKTTFIRPDEAFRLLEPLTHLEINQLVHAVGDGKHVLRPAMKDLRAWHKLQLRRTRNVLPGDFNMRGLWSQIRDTRKSNVYRPYAFVDVGVQRHESEWDIVAAQSLARMNAERLARPKEKRQASPKKAELRNRTP